MSPEQLKRVHQMDMESFGHYVSENCKPVKDLINVGLVAVEEVETFFSQFHYPVAYHVDKLVFDVKLSEPGLYGKVSLYRTKYGQPTSYHDLKEDSCFNRASVIIGRSKSQKLYFQSFRRVKGQWVASLQDAKRALTIHEDYEVFTHKEIQIVLDGLTRVNNVDTKRVKLDYKTPSVATIVM